MVVTVYSPGSLGTFLMCIAVVAEKGLGGFLVMFC